MIATDIMSTDKNICTKQTFPLWKYCKTEA